MFDKIKDFVSDITGGGDLGNLDLGEYEKYLEGVSWPVGKEDLVNALQSNGAPDQVVDRVQGISQDTFNGPQDLLGSLTGGGGNAADTAQAGRDVLDESAQTGRDNLGDVRKSI